jgi:hypothetical protein
MTDDILSFDKTEVDNYEQTDIFEWANNLLEFKGELEFDIFLINKKYIPYRTNIAKELHGQLEELFIDDILEYVLSGIEKGLIVRGFEEAEKEEDVLQRTQVFKVDKARETFRWIKTQEHELEIFSDDDHDFKRIKGLVARVSHPKMKRTFYIVKALPQSNVVRKQAGWFMKDGKFTKFEADAVVKIPSDNQLLILDQDIYVFSQTRLKQMFEYDAKEASIAEKKIKEILENYRLSLPDGVTIQDLIAGKKGIVKKLQKLDAKKIKQEEIVKHAEDLDIEMMEDTSGAIIIMDTKDLDKFVNLVNDDYMESPLTGEKYEIIKKRPIRVEEESTELI